MTLSNRIKPRAYQIINPSATCLKASVMHTRPDVNALCTQPNTAVSVSKINSSKLRKVNSDDDFHSKHQDDCHFHLIKSDKHLLSEMNN